MQTQQYEAPRSIAEAVSLLGSDAEARVLAGGTDLLVQMRSGRSRPQLLVDVKHIPRVASVELGPDGLRLGAGASCAEIRETAGIAEAYPGLVEATALIGSEQIQGRATVGGNLCNSSPAADTVPALIAVGARCVLAGPDGERELAAEDFVTAPGQNEMRPDEFLVELRIPAAPSRSADAYLRFIPRTEMDIAVVGAAVRIELDGAGRCSAARVALGAVAPTPILVPAAAEALVGTEIDAPALDRAGALASDACDPIDDKRGTAVYRRKVAAVLVRRAAGAAAERARARS